MKRKAFLGVILAIAVSWSSMLAAKTPEDTVHEYVAALQTEGLEAVARFIHPDDLARFKEMFMPLIRSEKLLDKQTFRVFLFDSDMTVAKVEAMSGADFMSSFMKRVGGMLPDLKIGPMNILGSVPEGDVIHVLARGSAEAAEIKITQVQVISIRRHEGGWKLLLDAKMEGFAAAFEKALK